MVKKKKKEMPLLARIKKVKQSENSHSKKSHITSLISKPSLNTLPCFWSWSQEVKIWDHGQTKAMAIPQIKIKPSFKQILV